MRSSEIRPIAQLGAAITLLACTSLSPVMAEDHQVTAVVDSSKTVTLLEPMVWMNAPGSLATRGVRLPAGVYVLEAEDHDYLYFRAPAPIEVRVLKDGEPVDGQDMAGGLAMAKGFNLVPAATYVDAGPGTKTQIFKHGSEFMAMRGDKWTKSF